MLTRQRKMHILDLLKRDGRIVAKDVSLELGLSEDTIRRDLRELAGDGLLQRVHGGALPSSPVLVRFADRNQSSSEAKLAIGRVAAGMIRPGQIVFVDGGTTTLSFVRCLSPDLKATIVTHSPTIAVALADHASLEVVTIGGTLFKHSVVATGASTIQAIADIRADRYVMGVTGIHPDIGLTTGHFEEAAVKRMLCRSAAETIVLASREKLGRASPYVVAPMEAVAMLIVEKEVAEETERKFGGFGIEVRGA